MSGVRLSDSAAAALLTPIYRVRMKLSSLADNSRTVTAAT